MAHFELAWPRVSRFPKLAFFLRLQTLCLSVALITLGIFWAIGQRVNPATIVLYAFSMGNLFSIAMVRLSSLTSARAFPYNWLIFLAALLVLTIPIYAIASVAVWWIAPPTPQTLEHLLRTGWKLPSFITVIIGVISFLYTETKGQLERRNLDLQRSVETGVARLEIQAQELERAREIQQSLLPKDIPRLPGFEVATSWQPARMVGGDYFDVIKLKGNRLAICIADVVGKGVSAALLMANVQAAVRAFAQASDSPAWVCSRVNGVLCENIATGKFVSFFYGVLDADCHTLQYCNAGHPPPMLVSSGATRQLAADGAVLGVFPSWKYEEQAIALHTGDRLLLYTDGITEASEADGQEFGEDNLAELAKANIASSASELNSRVLASVTDFCHGQFHDDATLVIVAADFK